MRVGILQSWLGDRYLPFWEAYLRALEVEVVRPQGLEGELPLPLPIRRVVQEALELKGQGVDYLLLPDAQLGVEAKRGSPSLWMVDLEAALAQFVPGLPPVLEVPAELSPELAGLAAQVGQTLSKNPMLARRALERTKRLLEPSYKPPQPLGEGVGIVAQPMLLQGEWLEGLRSALGQKGLRLLRADKPPAELRQEGAHLELGLELPTDLEAAGMHRYLSRLGRVRSLLYVHDPEYLPLPTPLRKLLRRHPPPKPWQVVGLEDDWSKVASGLVPD
ncbi:MAG: hypothetical protein NZ849_02565 [Meiothermus sp.]|uniref:hypothetical protein n=1 Tax=Meiothermus sp. TaxID=1955249 RepID=UPI0025EE4F1B|nr:hypothetical protein [Meiothermus sp.]MCS7193788.1 hypothetical protein [Meiothermus sp.]MDW8091620.1 hypothetical protein [Meiothermus sp.]